MISKCNSFMPTVSCVLNHYSLIRSTVNVSVVSVSIKRVFTNRRMRRALPCVAGGNGTPESQLKRL